MTAERTEADYRRLQRREPHDMYRQLIEDQLSDLLDDAGVLDTLRDFARLSGDTRGLIPTLQSAIGLAFNYENMVRRGVLDVVPEWVRTHQEAAE